MKFIALLRGINVGGNNKVAMPQLKACFEAAGFTSVVTYINSGNVIFESEQTNAVTLVKICEEAIQKQFGFYVVCSVISAAELLEALEHTPEWWNKGKARIRKSGGLSSDYFLVCANKNVQSNKIQ